MTRLTSIGALIVVITVLHPCKPDTKTTIAQSNAVDTDAPKRPPSEINNNPAATQTNDDDGDAQIFQSGPSYFAFPQVIPSQHIDPVEGIHRPNRQQPILQPYIPYEPTSNTITSMLNNQQISNGNIWNNSPQTIQQLSNQQVSNGNIWSNVQQSLQQLNGQQSKQQTLNIGIQDPSGQIDIVLGCPLAQQPVLYSLIAKYLDSNRYGTQRIPLSDTQNVQSSTAGGLNGNAWNQQQTTQQQQTTNIQSVIGPQIVQNTPSNYYQDYVYPSTYPTCQYPHCQVPCNSFYNLPILPICCLPFCGYPPFYDSYYNNNQNYFNNPAYNNNNMFNNNRNNPSISLNNNQKISSNTENTIIVDNTTNIDKVKLADTRYTVNSGNQMRTIKTQATNSNSEDNDQYLNNLFVPVWIGPEKKYSYLTGPKDYSN